MRLRRPQSSFGLIIELMMSNKPGYVALASVLVIASVVLTIGVSVALLSISQAQISLAGKKSDESLDLVEGCVEEALLRLNEDNAIPSQIVLPAGSCSVTIDALSGVDWTFTTSGSLGGHSKSVQLTASREATVVVGSWQEVE